MNYQQPSIVLQVDGISKKYAKVDALVNLSFTVSAGEIFGLLGPNGAGKTTAIRILTTILAASSGQFTLLGIPDSQSRQIRSMIGVVPESDGFPKSMTGAEYLIYIGQLYGMSKAQVTRRAEELLYKVGLTQVAYRYISTYSRGMKRRLSIARGLIHSPRLLFLDEPTLGIDPIGQHEILQIVKHTAMVDEVGIILSSHSLEAVDQICSRVLILKQGHMVSQGTISEIKQRFVLGLLCRIHVPPEDRDEAISVLSNHDSIDVSVSTVNNSEIIVSTQNNVLGQNDILHLLIQAGIRIESFFKDYISLSEAFLSMINEVEV